MGTKPVNKDAFAPVLEYVAAVEKNDEELEAA